ncbi:MAG: cold shock domain-containing protein [Flavobacteriales bacterium]|nr:cold shock domain-containing protein [Flavobacteriales bacterium]
MGKSQETFGKKEKEKKRLKKRKDKALKKEERKANAGGSDLDSMMAYVDENGQIVDTPPDPLKKVKIKASSIEIGVPKKEAIEDEQFRNGRVDFFNHDKGFGFIIAIGTQEKFFVHINNVIDDITEGNMVVFEVEKGAKGMDAVRVKKA